LSFAEILEKIASLVESPPFSDLIYFEKDFGLKTSGTNLQKLTIGKLILKDMLYKLFGDPRSRS
jgi:hypothetical protein